MTVPEIDAARAQQLLSEGATFIDVRDPESYLGRRIPGSLFLHDGNLAGFVAGADKARPVVVYCFKGNTSRGGAAMLLERGFREVYSLAGGIGAWTGQTESGAPRLEPPEGLRLSDLAASKLREFLAGEAPTTRVRITLDGDRFGLALDEVRADDGAFEVGELPFVVQRGLAAAVRGLDIGYLDQGPQQGFSLEGGSPPRPPGDEELREDIQRRIAEHKLMIFMKGTAQAPVCGFSARAAQILKELGRPFGDKNVLEHPRYRFVLSELSQWPTIPQVFLDGELLGGCDILVELHQKGELRAMVDRAFAEVPSA